MNKEDLRVKFLSEMPNRITNNDNRNYSEWLEDLIISETNTSIDSIESEGRVMAMCNNFINNVNKDKEGYVEAYIKGVRFALNKINKQSKCSVFTNS